MKNVLLIRHGKSSWEYSVSDKDRPLLLRGINDGHLIATALGGHKISIDAAFSSPANRALHTCMIVLRGLGLPFAKLEISNALYDFSGDSVLDFIHSLDDALDTVLLFGHNHAFTYLANSLGDTYIDNVPTSGLVQLTFDVDQWSDVSKGTTSLTLFPKQLKK